jgi:glucose-fructose oxidoreductase
MPPVPVFAIERGAERGPVLAPFAFMTAKKKDGRKRTVEPVRIAVVGLGHFAQTSVLPAIDQVDDVELVALVSGSPDKLRELGDRYGVERRVDYDGYEAMLEAGGIDAVYIATPNDRHTPFAVRAAHHDVHVLCEKPLAPSEAECRAIIRSCEGAGVILMVGYRLHFEAANLHAIDVASSGQIGEPRVLTTAFAMQVKQGNTRLDARPGAGPLYDIGIYCINAARYLFRDEPSEVVAVKLPHRTDPRFLHVDEGMAAILRFPGDRACTMICSFGTADHARYDVIGTAGTLALDHAYDLAEPMKLTIVADGKTRTRVFRPRDQVAAEIAYFAHCVRDRIPPEPNGWEGLADVRILNAIEEAARTGRAIAIDRIDRAMDPMPDPDQELHYPAHGKPRTVGVDSPSH